MPEQTAFLSASLTLVAATCLAGIVCVVKGVRWDNDRGEPGSAAHGSLTELWSARLLATASVSSGRHRRARAVLRSGGRTGDPELAPVVHALAATRIIYWWNPWTWSGQALLFVALAGTIGLNPATPLWGTAVGPATAVLAIGTVAAQSRMAARYGRALDTQAVRGVGRSAGGRSRAVTRPPRSPGNGRAA